ncbi:MAG: phage holin family protein [Fuerstiella sp.]
MIQEHTRTRGEKTAGTAGRRTARPGLGSLLYDLTCLTELQGRLFVHDLHELRTGVTIAIAMLAVGVVLAFATIPVLLMGAGWLLAEFLQWPVWAGLLTCAAAAGIVPGALLLYLGWRRLLKKSTVMTRSTAELRENARWLKRRLKTAL